MEQRIERRGKAGRRRDRHGRGLRTGLLPRSVPAWRSRAQRFDDLVLDAVERLEQRSGASLAQVEFAVEDVPPSEPAPWEDAAVPLGRLFPARGVLPVRIVVYRRPVETRAKDPDELADVVYGVLVHHVAHHLGQRPEQLDPDHDPD